MSYWYKKNKMQLLRSFCAVIEEGSILKACAKLNIAQSSVSAQISSLEKDLKIQLFKRENQRLSPTEEAFKFYKTCKRLVVDMDFMFENAAEVIKQDYDDKIRIAAHSYMLSHILPPYFKNMIEINSRVKFELHNSDYEEAIEMLETSSIDFAVFSVKEKDLPKNITMEKFHKCKFGICMTKEHPLANVNAEDITWECLAKYDYITLGKGATVPNAKSIIKEYGINSSRFRLFNGTWEISMGIIKQGLTIAGMDTLYGEWHRDIIMKECNNLTPNYIFYVLRNKKNVISKSAKALLDIMLPEEV